MPNRAINDRFLLRWRNRNVYNEGGYLMVGAVRDRITALVLLAISTIGWLQIEHISDAARFFPRTLLGLMAVIAVAMLARSFLRHESGTPEPFATSWISYFLVVSLTFALVL